MKNRKLVVGLVIALIVMAILSCGETATPAKVATVVPTEPVVTEPTDTPIPPQPEVNHIGDVVNIGNFNVQVNEVFEARGNEFNKPDEGKIFYIVDVTFNNTGSEAESISSLLQMSLQDVTGQKYTIDIMAIVAADGTSPDGEIGPGRKLRGQCGYLIPADATGLEWIFDASIWGIGQAIFKLDR